MNPINPLEEKEGEGEVEEESKRQVINERELLDSFFLLLLAPSTGCCKNPWM